MATKSVPIFWHGELVGEMLDPKADNFFLYGEWKPAASDTAKQFLEAVRREVADDGDVEVMFGEQSVAFISVEPDDEIEVKVYPHLNPST